MQLYELFLMAVGLSMDAFAVSICKGLAMKKITFSKAVIVGLWFGVFQALMPALGFFLGSRFQAQIEAIDHWIAFLILALIGANMLREAWKDKKESACECQEEEKDADLSVPTMLLLAIATSIDALAAGITFALLKAHLTFAVTFIGCTTFVLSAAGVYVGHFFGTKFKYAAEICGGVILILIGLKILLQHLGVLTF